VNFVKAPSFPQRIPVKFYDDVSLKDVDILFYKILIKREWRRSMCYRSFRSSSVSQNKCPHDCKRCWLWTRRVSQYIRPCERDDHFIETL